MEIINYPLVYYTLQEDVYLGILVGTPYQAIEKSPRQLKTVLLEQLRREYKKYSDIPSFEVREPKLKIIHTDARTIWRKYPDFTPLTRSTKVNIPLVYGRLNENTHACYFPLFQRFFYYHDARQLDVIAKHEALILLHTYTSETIYRWMRYPHPKMELLSLRVHTKREYDWERLFRHARADARPPLVDPFPPPKSVRRAGAQLVDAAWELEDRVALIVDKLFHTRANILVVGPRGVGKSAALRQAIRKVIQLSRKSRQPLTFWRALARQITASGQYLGEWQAKLESIVESLRNAQGVLWILDVAQLLKAGGTGPEDSMAAYLIAFLRQGELQLVGEATPTELESMRRMLPSFVDCFQIVTIEELPEDRLYSVLAKYTRHVEKNHGVSVTRDALETAFRLLHRFFPYESFPGKGINFLNQCVNEARQEGKNTVDKTLAIDRFVRATGLPPVLLRDDIPLDLDWLRRFFNDRVIGQPAAMEKICETIKIFKTGLNNPRRPIATFLFAGPTGVGKSESAKVLAEFFFGQGQKQAPLIAIDMSEFVHPSQIHRLIGESGDVGRLTREVREKPFAVILLDEIEKAHEWVYDALLTLLDEGAMTDAYGRPTNFRNTIVIMTTNLGVNERPAVSYQPAALDEKRYLSAIERHFRPEFVNRIDAILFFNPLKEEDLRRIARKELQALEKREGFNKQGLRIHFKESVVEYLLRTGFDQRYGARPLRRAIEQYVVAPIANWLLNHPHTADADLWIEYSDCLHIEVV
jgi:ATP-dependent Clp protease ATP-binding subunit ClpC